MTYYSREISLPKTRREGLENFIQIAINRLEAGDHQEALLGLVDLLEDIRCRIYDGALTDPRGADRLAKEMQARHTAEVIKASEDGYARGVADEKARMAKALQLIA